MTGAVREAGRFDRRAVSPEAGLLAAIPVATVLGAGTAVGGPVAGATMGAGAMLVGIAWRVGGGRPPLAVLATDAVVMAASTFVGCVTGSITWLHLLLLCLWSLMGGLLVAAGNRGAVVGTQAIIAFVVFGRFSQPVAASLGLAALVLAGGLAQVVFLSIVRWPPPLRLQRSAVAAAYRALAALATSPWGTSTLPAAGALDQARNALASPTLFGDPALMTLRSLVNEGLRMRVQLSAIHALLGRPGARAGDHSEPAREAAQRVLELTGAALELAARAIEGDRDAAAALDELVAALSSEAAAGVPTGGAAAGVPTPGATELHLARRLEALAGQLRAVAALAPTAGEGAGLRARRPQPRANRPLEQVKTNLAQVRANARLDSPAGRHALRLAVVVIVAELLSRVLPLQRSYWMVVAAATVLRPEFGATFTRGTERALGTCLGVALAGLIAVALHPAGAITTVIVGLLAWAGYATFPASFAVGFAFITAVVVFLLNAISPDTLATANARLLDTLVGAAIGLAAYALWPTWSHASARHSLADLVAAERAYAGAVLGAVIDGRQAEEPKMRGLARRARLARTTAEADVARSLSEPETRRIDADQSQGTLAVMRRLIQAVHVMRLDAQEERHRRPLPALRPLAAGVDRLLSSVEAAFRSTDQPPSAPAPPDLRANYSAFERTAAPADVDSTALLGELDEIVDAVNGLAEMAGLESDEGDEDADQETPRDDENADGQSGTRG